MKICIVIPTYNEALNITKIVPEIFACCQEPGLEICVVDDGSPDHTADQAESLGDPRVHVLRRTGERGYGMACNDGIRFALAHGAEFIITMDADFAHQPSALNSMLQAAREADLVIGSRYLGAHAKVEDWPLLRRLLSRFAGMYIRVMTGMPTRDPTTGFRCWRASFLRNIPLDELESKGYAYLYETLFFAGQRDARLREVDNTLIDRTEGESKMDTEVVLEALWLPLRLRLGWLQDRLVALRKWEWLLLAILSVVYFSATILKSRAEPFQYDELFTVHLANLPLSDFWKALSEGTDLQPPLSYLLVRGTRGLLGPGETATRLPSILALWAFLMSLYAYVRRRLEVESALVVWLFPCLTSAWDLATSARPYAIMLAACGCSLLAWQSATENRHRPLALCGLFLSLAAGMAAHYFAVLLLLPIAVGELLRSAKRRNPIDVPVWTAMGLSLLPLLFPLSIRSGMRSYSPAFWVKAEFHITYIYDFVSSIAPLLLVALLLMLQNPRWLARPRRDLAPSPKVPVYEFAAALMLLGIPVWAYLLALETGAGLSPRYIKCVIVGAALLLGYLLGQFTTGFLQIRWAIVLTLFGAFLLLPIRTSFLPAEPVDPVVAIVSGAGANENLPVVIDSPLLYLPAAYYASRGLESRLHYVADLAQSRDRIGADTGDRAMISLAKYAPLQVDSYAAFTASNPEFLVVRSGQPAWLLGKLMDDGLEVELRGMLGDLQIYQVRAAKR